MSSKFFVRPAVRRWLHTATLAGMALLASCGGGTQVEPFKPTRVLAFGDELSVIEADGRKYTINAFKQVTVDGVTSEDPTTLDCVRNPIWIQIVATGFGLAFDRCLGSATTAGGQVLAQVGHKVDDLSAQVAAVTGDALGEKDLALVMIGLNDILELYARYPTTGRDALLDEARARGEALGSKINQMAKSGPAVVVLTVPDIGLSPFAQAQNISTGDATRSALLSDLVKKFNDRTSVTLINDGRLIGLVYGDIEIQNMVKFPSSYGLVNVVAPACKAEAVLPGCTTATLVDTATSTTWLWADAWRLSPAGQSRLGVLADGRARSNPF
jgi:outer membrane lipase/esterase